MAGKAKFDQEAAFKSIIGAGREPESESRENPKTNTERGHRKQC